MEEQDEILQQLKQDLLAEDHVPGEPDNFWQRFKNQSRSKWALYGLIVLVTVAILSPILSNQLPLYAKYKGESFYPVFTTKKYYQLDDGSKISVNYTNWKRMELDAVLWAPISYSANKTDKNNGYVNADYVGPFDRQLFEKKDGELVPLSKRHWHWMGTNRLGEDVFAIMIHGTKTALWVGLFAAWLATIIGIIIGLSIGYFGNGLKINRWGGITSFVGIIPGIFYAFVVRKFTLLDASRDTPGWFWIEFMISLAVIGLFMVLFYFLGKGLSKLFKQQGVWKFPLDTFVIKVIEVKTAIPGIVLIIALLAIFEKPSMWHLVFIIGFTAWGGIARIARAEVLRIRSLEYVEAAKALGMTEFRIVFKHILLNSLGPVLVVTAFSSASAILVEAGLSFLGIGLPSDVASWGSLISAGKDKFDAWWLVVFPGLAIFAVVMMFNLIGEGVRDALDPKVK